MQLLLDFNHDYKAGLLYGLTNGTYLHMGDSVNAIGAR